MRKLSYGRAVLLLLAVFAGGAAVGGFGVSLYSARTVNASPPPTPVAWREKYVKDMGERLKLSGEQVTKLNTILDDTRAQYDAVKARYKPEMDRIHEAQIASIRAMLDEKQSTDYDRFRAERDRERKKAQQQQAAASGK